MTEISKYITIIRPEFMTFCKDACRAATFNHLLFRIAGKAKDQPRENIQDGKILWYAKTELITSEMSDAWGVCKVRKEVNALVSMGLIGKKSNPTWGVDRTKHFCFGSEQCETFLRYCEEQNICVVHLDLPNEVKHLIYLSLANDTSIKCTCEKGNLEQANDTSIGCKSYMYQMHSINLSDAFDKSIGTITKTTTKTSNKDNDKEESSVPRESEIATSGTDVPTHAHSSQSCDPLAISEQDSVTETHSQLSTLAVDKSTRSSAKLSEKKKSTSQKKSEPVLAFTPEGQKVSDAWGSLFKSPPRVGEKTIDCANDLAPRLIPWCKDLKMSCRDLLDEIRRWEYATDPEYYRKRGVTLCDVGRDFERWQSAKTEEIERKKQPEKRSQSISGLGRWVPPGVTAKA